MHLSSLSRHRTHELQLVPTVHSRVLTQSCIVHGSGIRICFVPSPSIGRRISRPGRTAAIGSSGASHHSKDTATPISPPPPPLPAPPPPPTPPPTPPLWTAPVWLFLLTGGGGGASEANTGASNSGNAASTMDRRRSSIPSCFNALTCRRVGEGGRGRAGEGERIVGVSWVSWGCGLGTHLPSSNIPSSFTHHAPHDTQKHYSSPYSAPPRYFNTHTPRRTT